MGDGWAPAILNTRREMDFIQQGQRSFSDNRGYWIGGKTNTQTGDFLDYPAYNATTFSNYEFNTSEYTGLFLLRF